MCSESKPPVLNYAFANVKPELEQVIDSCSSISSNSSIHDLISILRSSFQQNEFDAVEKILTSREVNLKRRLNEALDDARKWKKEYEFIEKKHGELALDTVVKEDESKKYKRENDLMRERITRFEEEQRMRCEREKTAEQRYRNLLEEERIMHEDRERRAEERYRKLLEEYDITDVERKDKTVELTNEDVELSRDKKGLEADLDARKKGFTELESRVLKLEGDTSTLVNLKKRIRVGARNGPLPQEGAGSANKTINSSLARSGISGVADVVEINDNSGDSEDEVPIILRSTSSPCVRNVCTENDFMASMCNRKRAPTYDAREFNIDGDDNSLSMNKKIQDLIHDSKGTDHEKQKDIPPSSCIPAFIGRREERAGALQYACNSSTDDSSDSGDDDSDSCINKIIANLKRKSWVLD